MTQPSCFKGCGNPATHVTSTTLPAGLVLLRHYCKAHAPSKAVVR